MTTTDRGAYAPQHDGPSMSFDPRRGRSRQPAPFTLIFSGVVLVALIAAIFMFYRGGVREAGAPPATVGDPVVAMKGPAAVDAQPLDAEESLDVYVEREEQVAALTPPAFAAPPEQPQPRPAPRPAPVVVAAAPVTAPLRAAAQPAASRPTQVASTRPTPTPAASTPAVRPAQVAASTRSEPVARPAQVAASASATRPAPVAASTPAATRPMQVAAATPAPMIAAPRPAIVASGLPLAMANPAPVVAAVAAPAAVAAAAVRTAPVAASTSGGYGVQIGAFSSQALADSEYAKVAGSFGMAGRGKAVTPVQAKGTTVYRTVVTGFGSREQAATVCAQIKASGRDCFVKGS